MEGRGFEPGTLRAQGELSTTELSLIIYFLKCAGYATKFTLEKPYNKRWMQEFVSMREPRVIGGCKSHVPIYVIVPAYRTNTSKQICCKLFFVEIENEGELFLLLPT